MQNKTQWGKTIVTAIITAAITVPVTTIISGFYKKTKDFTLELVGLPQLRPAEQGKIMVDIMPIRKYKGDHRFFSMGHTHYITEYCINVINRNIITPLRVSMQINSNNGTIVRIKIPKITKGRFPDGTDVTEWVGRGHGKDPCLVVIEFDLSPACSKIPIDIFIESMRGYIQDDDVSAQLVYPGGLSEARAQKVVWNSEK